MAALVPLISWQQGRLIQLPVWLDQLPGRGKAPQRQLMYLAAVTTSIEHSPVFSCSVKILDSTPPDHVGLMRSASYISFSKGMRQRMQALAA